MAGDDFSTSAINYLIAKDALDQSRSYLQRGRCFHALSEADLETKFIDLFRRWVAALPDAQCRQAIDDISAEYGLRAIEPPFDKLEAEREILTEHVKMVHEAMSEERKQAIGGEIIEDYASALRKQQ